MIDRREILDVATRMSLTPHIVERDYVLGWMLAGISAHPELRDSWVFKGGTCLKKCFFETYRFSEDLDFTLLASAFRPTPSAALRAAPSNEQAASQEAPDDRAGRALASPVRWLRPKPQSA
jgi:hypothetical protein